MRYFEFIDPYYALIKAPGLHGAVTEYIRVVSGEDSDFYDILAEAKEITEESAFKTFVEVEGSDTLTEDALLVDFKNGVTEVLLIDGSLL